MYGCVQWRIQGGGVGGLTSLKGILFIIRTDLYRTKSHLCVCGRVCMCVCMYVCMYVCMCVYVLGCVLVRFLGCVYEGRCVRCGWAGGVGSIWVCVCQFYSCQA